MNKICTSIEQSQKLIELGIDVNTADMMWDDWSLIDDEWHIFVGYDPEIEQDYGRKCYPAWSLSALLELIPKHIKQNDGRTYKFHIFNDDGIVIQRWGCSYCAEDFHNRAEYLSDPHLKYPTNVYSDKYEDPIDAVFEMIIWLKENRKI